MTIVRGDEGQKFFAGPSCGMHLAGNSILTGRLRLNYSTVWKIGKNLKKGGRIMVKLRKLQCKCKECGHIWNPRKYGTSQCPNCRAVYLDKYDDYMIVMSKNDHLHNKCPYCCNWPHTQNDGQKKVKEEISLTQIIIELMIEAGGGFVSLNAATGECILWQSREAYFDKAKQFIIGRWMLSASDAYMFHHGMMADVLEV